MSQVGSVVEHPVLAGARAAAAGLATACRGAAWQLGGADVEGGLAALDVVEAAAALRARLLREAEGRGLRERTQALSTERWLSERFRCSRATASGR